MESVGIYEAKMKLSELVERAESGHEVVITRRGKPAVRLVPANAGAGGARAEAFAELDRMRREFKLRRRFRLRDLIGEGRR